MGFVRIAYSYLSTARTDGRHRLPIDWVIALLDDVKLVADTLTCALREVAQIVDGTSDEHDVLHAIEYTKVYILGKPPGACFRYQADRRYLSVRASDRSRRRPNRCRRDGLRGSDLRTVGGVIPIR
jgi:hypothetical protein